VSTTTMADSIVEEIAIEAPAGRIFEALTRPSEILNWWRAEGKFQITDFESDLRIGGKWMIRVAGAKTGTSSVVKGEYRAIEYPGRLSYTWQRFGEGEDEHETLVTWELDESAGTTTVRVSHTGLVTDDLRRRNSGWPLILKLIRNYLDTATQA
jgi:uncharacterized protein YndB with AHSA1/START domain